jgi:hypothetical protein
MAEGDVTGFLRKNLKEIDHLGDLGVDGETILKYN